MFYYFKCVAWRNLLLKDCAVINSHVNWNWIRGLCKGVTDAIMVIWEILVRWRKDVKLGKRRAGFDWQVHNFATGPYAFINTYLCIFKRGYKFIACIVNWISGRYVISAILNDEYREN